MTYQEMWDKQQEVLESINDLMIPGAYEYALKTEGAIEYMSQCQVGYTSAMCEGRVEDFKHELEKYYKAWARIWQLMAIEHFNSRPIEEVDHRYYRHMPDGNSFVMDSKKLGFKFRVYPRRPKNPPSDMKWMTSSDLLKMHESEAVLGVITAFEGDAWFDKDEADRIAEEIRVATLETQKRLKGVPHKLVRKKVKDGLEFYERETIRGRPAEVSQKAVKKRVRVQSERQILVGDSGSDDSDLG